MTPRLSQSFPWSEEEVGGFAISAVTASVLFALLYAWAQGPDAGTMLNPHVPMGSPAYRIRIPDPTYVPSYVVGILTLSGLVLLNATPVKRLHGLVQFLICAAGGAVLDRNEWALDGVVFSAMKAAVYGLLIFLALRVNWWFYWDVPSRRTTAERMVGSIFFTTLYPLGFGFGFWRLVFRIGIHNPTTEFVVDGDSPSAEPVEAIIEDPALAQHETRMSAIRAGQAGFGSGRTPAADKDSVSRSI